MALNKKILILLTAEDPLDGAQIFIKHELDTCASFYNHIYIFSETRKTSIPFKYCSNCEVIGLKFLKSKFKYFYYTLVGLLFGTRLKDTENVKGFKKKIFRLYERGKAVSMFNRVKRFIDHSSVVEINDFLFFYSYWFLNTATAAILLAKYFSKKEFCTKCFSRAHGYDLFSERNSLSYLPFQHFNVTNLDYIFPCSDSGKHYLCEKYRGFASKIFTARLGTIDCGVEAYTKTNITHFVTCSNLIPLKRVELFAKAFKLLSKEKDVFWTCIGDGPQKEPIIQILKDKGSCIPNNVSMRGRLSNSEILDFYYSNNVDYFVNISEYEGVPVSIMEAFSFGIPVIATDVGGTSEIVNSKNGILMNNVLAPNELKNILADSIDTYSAKKRACARKTWEGKCSANTNFCNFHKQLQGLFLK